LFLSGLSSFALPQEAHYIELFLYSPRFRCTSSKIGLALNPSVTFHFCNVLSATIMRLRAGIILVRQVVAFLLLCSFSGWIALPPPDFLPYRAVFLRDYAAPWLFAISPSGSKFCARGMRPTQIGDPIPKHDFLAVHHAMLFSSARLLF